MLYSRFKCAILKRTRNCCKSFVHIFLIYHINDGYLFISLCYYFPRIADSKLVGLKFSQAKMLCFYKWSGFTVHFIQSHLYCMNSFLCETFSTNKYLWRAYGSSKMSWTSNTDVIQSIMSLRLKSRAINCDKLIKSVLNIIVKVVKMRFIGLMFALANDRTPVSMSV